MNARRWWLPSLRTAIWLAFFLALTCSGWRVAMIGADGDPAYHWAHGNWMLEHRAVLRTDEFTHTRAGAPLTEMWWLSEIGFALAGNAFGWSGLVWLTALVIATTLWLLYRQLWREGVTAVVAGGAVLLAAAVCATHWLARPHLATHLLVVMVGGHLWRFQRGQIAGGHLLVILPVLMMLWVNLHSMFFTGLILISISIAGNLHRPRVAGTLVGVLVASVAATLVNPNGWQSYVYLARFLGNRFLVAFAQECAPPNLLATESIGLWLILMALAFALVVERRNVTATEWLLVVVWLALALRMRRNMPLFALIATPILGRHADAWLARRRSFRRFAARVDGIEREADGRAWMALAMVVVVMARIKTEPSATQYPVDAVAFLRRQPVAMTGEMFNAFDWGGYLMRMLPERRVFIYSRVDDESLIRDFNVIDDAQTGWETVLAKYDVGWTLLPRAHRLNQLLARQAGWRVAYTDTVATVYSRSAL